MTGCGIMSTVWGTILQGGSTIKESIDLPVTTRHCCHMTEILLKATVNLNKQQQHITRPNSTLLCEYDGKPFSPSDSTLNNKYTEHLTKLIACCAILAKEKLSLFEISLPEKMVVKNALCKICLSLHCVKIGCCFYKFFKALLF